MEKTNNKCHTNFMNKVHILGLKPDVPWLMNWGKKKSDLWCQMNFEDICKVFRFRLANSTKLTVNQIEIQFLIMLNWVSKKFCELLDLQLDHMVRAKPIGFNHLMKIIEILNETNNKCHANFLNKVHISKLKSNFKVMLACWCS